MVNRRGELRVQMQACIAKAATDQAHNTFPRWDVAARQKAL
jgi:hypothetical protein